MKKSEAGKAGPLLTIEIKLQQLHDLFPLGHPPMLSIYNVQQSSTRCVKESSSTLSALSIDYDSEFYVWCVYPQSTT